MLHVAWIKNECESVDRSVTVHHPRGFILTVEVLLFISPKKAYRTGVLKDCMFLGMLR